MRRKPFGDFWFVIFLFFVLGGSGVLPGLLLFAIMGFVVYKAIQSANKNQNNNSFNRSYTRSYGYTERKNGNVHTSSDLAKINVFLRKYFKAHNSLFVLDGLELIPRTDKYSSLSSLDVYRNGSRIGTINEYRNKYGQAYDELFDALLKLATSENSVKQTTIVDAEIVDNSTEKPKQETEIKQEVKETPISKSQKYINEINALNDDIPHEEISNGLYETCALLKQVQILENKFPDSAKKLDKMYEYYLPYLVKILHTYENLQTVKSDPNYEKSVDQLTRTIKSINEALNNIIPTLSDSDFTNLSVDMATLEALLQKDGLTGGMDSVESTATKK